MKAKRTMVRIDPFARFKVIHLLGASFLSKQGFSQQVVVL